MAETDYSDILQNVSDDAPAWDVLEKVFKKDKNKPLADNAGALVKNMELASSESDVFRELKISDMKEIPKDQWDSYIELIGVQNEWEKNNNIKPEHVVTVIDNFREILLRKKNIPSSK